jgi:hypothetical protein
MAANTPAPIIEPNRITTASPTPRRRSSRLGASVTGLSSRTAVVVVVDELHLDAAGLCQERRVHPGVVTTMRASAEVSRSSAQSSTNSATSDRALPCTALTSSVMVAPTALRIAASTATTASGSCS